MDASAECNGIIARRAKGPGNKLTLRELEKKWRSRSSKKGVNNMPSTVWLAFWYILAVALYRHFTH